MRFNYFIVFVAVVILSSCAETRIHDKEEDWGAIFKSHGVNDGCFIMRDHTHEEIYYYNKERSLRRYIPASTFKIFNSLVALETSTRVSELQRQRLAVADMQRRVDELNVRSPVDGVVGTLSVADRTVVAANTALMTVVDLSRLEVELEIPESYADDLGLGMNVEVNIGSTQATGKLSALSPEVVRNQVLARVRFDGQQPAGLRQSQRLTARILIEEKPDVLMLPRGPFVENEGGRAAYVMDGDLAVRRPIQIGATSVSAVEIVSGLQAGERVVVSGTDTFEDAERVSIND